MYSYGCLCVASSGMTRGRLRAAPPRATLPPMVLTAGPRTRPGRLAALCVARLAPLALALPGTALAGADWSVAAAVAGLPESLGQGARLAASPASDEVVWLTLGDGRVYVSTDAGLTWAGQRLTPGRVSPLPKPSPLQRREIVGRLCCSWTTIS